MEIAQCEIPHPIRGWSPLRSSPASWFGLCRCAGVFPAHSPSQYSTSNIQALALVAAAPTGLGCAHSYLARCATPLRRVRSKGECCGALRLRRGWPCAGPARADVASAPCGTRDRVRNCAGYAGGLLDCSARSSVVGFDGGIRRDGGGSVWNLSVARNAGRGADTGFLIATPVVTGGFLRARLACSRLWGIFTPIGRSRHESIIDFVWITRRTHRSSRTFPLRSRRNFALHRVCRRPPTRVSPGSQAP